MSQKNIVLGVTGSIASYKAAELTSLLVKRGFSVHVVMTAAATSFIAPLTFQTLSGNPVHVDMFSPPKDWNVEHIGLAQMADLLLIAPATANFIGKIAAGIADDLLSATVLATKAPVVIAPAMNVGMYENKIFQRNMKLLREYGYYFVEPEEGRLACGTAGKGRLADLEKIIKVVENLIFREQDLSGKKVLVTAGPTREPLDPVRFLSNYSSGKMGYALAEEARERGAEVVLVSGPTGLSPPPGVKVDFVETAQEMFEAVLNYFPEVDVVVKAAAVADFRPKQVAPEKVKKRGFCMVIELEATPDILFHLGKQKNKQILVGFAAETENLLENAREKLREKNLDLLVANDLKQEGAGFQVDTNIATILYPDGGVLRLPKMTKKELARVIFDEVVKLIKLREKEGDR